jgi:hypothetical protein
VQLTSRGRALLGSVLTIAIALTVIGAWVTARAVGDGTPSPVAAPSITPTSAVATPSPTVVAASPTPVPSRASQPTHKPRAAIRSTGRLVVVPGSSAVVGHGSLRRFKVEVESGVGISGSSFASAVLRTLSDGRSWGSDHSFKRVSSGPVSFTVTLASPGTTDRLCAPLSTGGVLSCWNSRGRSVINVNRWRYGANSYSGHLAEYRDYVVSHEVGHALGHGHESSCRSDGLAPVMMQQTKSLYGCKRNPWPHPHESG